MKKLSARNNEGKIVRFDVINGVVSCNGQKLVKIIYVPENVTVLHCSNNMLTSLPKMKSLRVLFCRDNKLAKLPAMHELLSLYCDNNELATFPTMRKIEYLDCSNNKLTKLPRLKSIKGLNISNNNIITYRIKNTGFTKHSGSNGYRGTDMVENLRSKKIID